MPKTLGGTQFIRNGLEYDYCFQESILNLLDFCDKVCVVDAGSTDGTSLVLRDMENDYPNLKVKYLKPEDWENTKGMGKAKLCHFTDMAIEMLDTDYNYYQQGDEITHEDSFEYIREAIEKGSEAYMIKRINLWQSPFMELKVPPNRMPCSTEVIRLALSKFRSYGDAESLRVDHLDHSFTDRIEMWHMGFVRKRSVMKDKIINMQCGVFEMADYDSKLKDVPEFDPFLWFNWDELQPINKPLPNIIQKWAFQRI